MLQFEKVLMQSTYVTMELAKTLETLTNVTASKDIPDLIVKRKLMNVNQHHA
jgi:hypothetical protein